VLNIVDEGWDTCEGELTSVGTNRGGNDNGKEA